MDTEGEVLVLAATAADAAVAASWPGPRMRIDRTDHATFRMDEPLDAAQDTGLWSAIAAGQPLAFALLMDRHGPRFLAHALAVTGDRALAEDAVQDVLLALVERPALIAGASHPPGYIARMVRNRAVDLLRRRPPAVPDGGDLVSAACIAFVMPVDDDDAERTIRINAALAELPTEQREVVVLKVVHGLTFAAIADAMGTTLNTAASRHRYAMEKLTHLLEDLGHES